MMFKRQPKDPNERVAAALAVLRQQHRENNLRDIGLINMPKHERAMQDLVRIGADAVPALVQTLCAPRPGTDTPQGQVEDGVANDIADVLGDIGDPRAVEPLTAQFQHYIVTAQRALARFPQGVDALLGGLDDSDEFVRCCCVQGLGFARADRARAAMGITKALDDPYDHNRERAAMAARLLGYAEPQLISRLQQVAADDPTRRVRDKALDALHQLNRT
jgi:HEAT repeat protein